MGAGIMLLCGNKTLIMKRTHYKYDKWSSYWNFPGGQGEPNETTYQTALRETEEETHTISFYDIVKFSNLFCVLRATTYKIQIYLCEASTRKG